MTNTNTRTTLRPLLLAVTFTDTEARFVMQHGDGLELVAPLPLMVDMSQQGDEYAVTLFTADAPSVRLFGFNVAADSPLLLTLCRELVSLCERCNAPGALPVDRPGYSEMLCLTCAQAARREDDAAQALHAALWPAVQAWARTWAAQGVRPGALAAMLEVEGIHWHPLGALHSPGTSGEGAELAVRGALAD